MAAEPLDPRQLALRRVAIDPSLLAHRDVPALAPPTIVVVGPCVAPDYTTIDHMMVRPERNSPSELRRGACYTVRMLPRTGARVAPANPENEDA
eukprot:scaffold154_cov373-Prasinococcus_capsulatus_cf.AAC.14